MNISISSNEISRSTDIWQTDKRIDSVLVILSINYQFFPASTTDYSYLLNPSPSSIGPKVDGGRQFFQRPLRRPFEICQAQPYRFFVVFFYWFFDDKKNAYELFFFYTNSSVLDEVIFKKKIAFSCFLKVNLLKMYIQWLLNMTMIMSTLKILSHELAVPAKR